MNNQRRLLNPLPKTLGERYFSKIRPQLYLRHAHHHQYGSRIGRTLAEHLDSACQFILTVTKIAKVPEDKRGLILAATAVHDLNKLDKQERKVKVLARDRQFLREQLDEACVLDLVKNDDDLELVRRLIERHSGHNVSDGAILFPEDPNIKRWAAMVTGADLFDLGIPESERLRKVKNELTVAFGRRSNLFRIRLSEDRGYITALLLGACEEILADYELTPLALFPDGVIFEGSAWPSEDLTLKIASRWQAKIDEVFGNNIEQLVRATKDGIKVSQQAIQQNVDEVVSNILALLEKKKASFKLDKINNDVEKWGEEAGTEALQKALEVGLLPVSNAEEFGIAEGLKAAYLSYGEAGLKTNNRWEKIAEKVGISEQQKIVLESFNAQYGRPLFAAKAALRGLEGIESALRESFELRKENSQKSETSEASEEMVAAVARLLSLPNSGALNGIEYLMAYIEPNPRKRCSLGSTFGETDDLSSNSMPPGTKVQVFSNRLPGGISAEPKRQADSLAALSYQLMAVGANFPGKVKENPLYLHLALPKNSSPELLRIWREFLQKLAATNADGGVVTVNELKLYKDNELEFTANKVVGFAFPKRPNFIYTRVVIPLLWGDANSSMALLKSLRLALELSLSLEFGFPFTLSGNLEVELSEDSFARVEGIPASLQSLLTTGQYNRSDADQSLLTTGQYNRSDAEDILKRLRCIGKLATAVSTIQKADDCLYDLARATTQSFRLYYVLLRWILREQDDPNLEYNWKQIKEPLNTLLESLMPNENTLLTQYLKEAAKIAAEAHLKGSSFKRTSLAEPFTAFTAAVRSHKSYMDLDFMFAALAQKYHTRLDRIRDYQVGETKYEQIKQYYAVLRKLYEEVYQGRPEKLLSDQNNLEAAYLFFWQEAYQQLPKPKKDEKYNENTASI
ncbi:CRISPR-associated protein Csc3 [Planktothricoides sp. SR001]|uniref:CRISPR-associated protein Csc3 n=1 Tax=Planktothricoides sp. SR001 TaxID=1705388 RepID=UPI0006C69C98|nr:CRISPR-associated protein Csc3 [Planktothricoides sp. SR001]KOR38300.1 CRISPR-associated protein Csc3 [Planktothricoides sp. SR001]